MSSKRILIIDDEENMLHMLKTILSKEGYEIITARNGIEGLEKIETNLFDTILCDLRMPEMDGLSFLKTVKVKNIHSTIIMMSAYGTIDLAVEAMKHGAYDYISKPFDNDKIISLVRNAARLSR